MNRDPFMDGLHIAQELLGKAASAYERGANRNARHNLRLARDVLDELRRDLGERIDLAQ